MTMVVDRGQLQDVVWNGSTGRPRKCLKLDAEWCQESSKRIPRETLGNERSRRPREVRQVGEEMGVGNKFAGFGVRFYLGKVIQLFQQGRHDEHCVIGSRAR